MHILTLLLLATPLFAACPKNKKEWQAKGPKLFLQEAAKQKAPVEITDFSKKLGKGKSATAAAFPFKDRNTDFAMIRAEDKDTTLFLSGVMRCDAAKKEPVLLSLTWVKDGKSGIVKVTH